MGNTMIPASERQASSRLDRDLSVTLENMHVAGNVQGSITIGSENVVGNDNIVVNTHDGHGAVVNIIKGPQEVHPHGVPGQPLRSPRGFTGRQSYLDQLDGYIQNNERVLVYGQDGIGKTALLAQASNGKAVLSKPDGVVYLEGIDEEGKLLGKGDIIQRLFDALYQSSPPLKVTFPTARPYLSIMQVVALFDHLSDDLSMKDWIDFSELFPKGAVLVASENPPDDDAFLPISLPPLAREESIQLLANKSGVTLDGTTRSLFDQICDRLWDVPLAISKTATAIRQYGFTLETVAEHLTAIQPPSQDSVQAAIERSLGLIYSALNQQEREMLTITAAAPGNSVDRAWLEQHAGGENTSRMLESLELLFANSPRLRLSDGVKNSIKPDGKEISTLREPLLHHLLKELKTRSLDFQFVRDELGNILGLLQWASKEGRWSEVIALGRAVDPYLTMHGLWDAWESVLKQVLTAAQNLKDLATRGWALHQLGTREIGVGTRKRAIDFLWRAITIRLSKGDLDGAAYTWHNLRLLIPPEPRDPPNEPVQPDPPTIWQQILETSRHNEWIVVGALVGIAIIIALLFLPSLDLTITADPIRYHRSTQEIHYSYIIENSGFVRVSSPVLVNKIHQDRATCQKVHSTGNLDDFLDSGESIICETWYSITDGDVSKPFVTNTAQAVADEGRVRSLWEFVTISFDPNFLQLTKKANTNTYSNPGENIIFAYLVKNKSETALNGPVLIEDDKLQGIKCQDPIEIGDLDEVLDPDESLACTAFYTITPEDVRNRSVTNNAQASVGGVVSNIASVTIYWSDSPHETPLPTLFKFADPENYWNAGDKIEYTYLVTNGSEGPLNGQVTIEDDKIGDPCITFPGIDSQDVTLVRAEFIKCVAPYTITQGDFIDGSVTNTAVASVGDTHSNPVSVTIYRGIPPIPTLKVSGSANPGAYDHINQIIEFQYRVENTSKVPLEGHVTVEVTVEDHLLQVNCDVSTVGNRDEYLDLNKPLICRATYSITQADIDRIHDVFKRSYLTSRAVVSIGELESRSVWLTILGPKPDPKLFLNKTAKPETYDHVNQEITYNYEITNIGNVTVKLPFEITDDHIHIQDNKLFLCETDEQQLAPNDSITCSKPYIISQADFNFGNSAVTNTATASGEFHGERIVSPPATTTITCPYPPKEKLLYPYIVESGVSLENIVGWYKNITKEELQRANCMGLLEEAKDIAEHTLYVPGPPPPATISGAIYDTQGNRLDIDNFPVYLSISRNGAAIAETLTLHGWFTLSVSTPGTYYVYGNKVQLNRGDNPGNLRIVLITP